jgi:hypothetical protein
VTTSEVVEVLRAVRTQIVDVDILDRLVLEAFGRDPSVLDAAIRHVSDACGELGFSESMRKFGNDHTIPEYADLLDRAIRLAS